jgi:psiF repeat
MKTRSTLAVIAAVTLGALTASAMAVTPEPPATPSAVPVKHPSLKTCNQRADAKKLSGKERSQFVQACQAGKSG